jgi:two-component system chemotaxis sensor kinase CheA
MNLVGELVLARNQILQQDQGGQGAAQRLNQITTALQEGVMKARMQPIGHVWGKLPRVVRDLATACGKQVRLETSGAHTELDRAIIEAIRDPLTHLIRNAVDHGVESPEQRLAAGKPPTGTLRLRAYHENGQVVMELADDGAGIDPARIARHAIERALITPEQATRMTDRDLVRLVFLPGFSTAERVTSVSGRGVGMDVVRTNIAAIGGAVDIQSALGVGTTIRVRIPLTLAIIPALIVEAGGDRYAIPQANLLELVRLGPLEVVERIRETTVHRLRGSLLPLVDLAEALEVEVEPGDSSSPSPRTIVVLQTEGRTFGLVVSAVLDSQEIVVKPIGRQLGGLSCYAGAAILGDGRVALILDISGLSRLSRIGTVEHGEEAAARRAPLQPFLIVRAGRLGRLAVPLNQVARLEKLPARAIEFADGREVAQYRGGILPLLRVPGTEPEGPDGLLRVVVHETEEGPVGFVVDAILDVVEDVGEVCRATRRPGRVGTTVIGGQVTDLLDLPTLMTVLAAGQTLAAVGREG